MALFAMGSFCYISRINKDMRSIMHMLAFNCLLMVGLYILLAFDVTLPDLTGRINLTLILTTLNVSAYILLDRSKHGFN